jgi:thymidylate synthase
MKVYENIHSAYLGSLAEVYDNPEYTASPRGQATKEITDFSFRITQPKPEIIQTKDEKRNKVIESYSNKEFELYDSCTNDVEDFAKASKFWKQLANPDGTVNSAYGYLIWKNKSHGNPKFEFEDQFAIAAKAEDDGIYDISDYYTHINEYTDRGMRTPWEWAKESLLNDKDTRQAILRFSLPEHQYLGNCDQTCTLHGNFMIRDNKLNLSITMRSNDLMLGLVYDLPWFISLMYKMQDELSEKYPGLEIGTYTHTVHSMHLYMRDEEKILKMLGRQ